jgi:uncharacterized protein YndB with AHSA1/START domain
MNADRIEKQVLLHVPCERVWKAISEADPFGARFGVSFNGPFRQGARLTGSIVPTSVDAEIAKLQEPHAGKPFEFWVDQIESMRYIAFHWHPFAVESGIDYAQEPTTLIAKYLAAPPAA